MGVGMKRTGGKYVTDLGGHRWPMDSILKAVRQAGGCRALVHKRGWVDLGETAAARLPDDRYRHCRSKHADWAVRHVVGTVAAMPAQDRKRLRATWVDQRTADQGAGLLEEAGVAQCMVDLLDAAEAQVPAAQATERSVPDGAPQAREDAMRTTATTGERGQGADRAKRFSTWDHGEMLLTAVAEFQRRHGYPTMFDRWKEFAADANASAHLSRWAGDSVCWYGRYHMAVRMFSVEAKARREVAQRVLDRLRAKGETRQALAAAVGVTPSRMSDYLQGVVPIPDAVLRDIALALDVSAEELRGEPGAAPRAVDPIPAPSPAEPQMTLDKLRGPSEEAQRARAKPLFKGEGAGLDAAGQAQRDRWSRTLDRLRGVVAVGNGLDADQLRGVVAYLEGQDLLDYVVE